MEFNDEEMRRPNVSDIGSTVPVRGVCPVDAISVNESGEPRIDESSCIDCGLCQSRCPVGAIVTGTESGALSVRKASEFQETEINFFELRDTFRASRPKAPRTETHLDGRLERALERLAALRPTEKNIAVRLLVRNIFIQLGARTSLRIQGANSLLSELVAESNGLTYLIEIETNDDTLDAFRRLLSATARAVSTEHKKIDSIIPLMVVPQLPNRRVDLYRLASDASTFLSLDFRIVPYSALIAAAYTDQTDAFETFGNFKINSEPGALAETAQNLFWPGVERCGFIPEK